VPAGWPGDVRHGGGASPVCGFCTEHGKASADTALLRRGGVRGVRGSAPSGGNREVPSTDAVLAGGPARSSGEAPVIGVERRGRLIDDLFARTTGSSPGGNEWACQVRRTNLLLFRSSWCWRRTEGSRRTRVRPEWTVCRSRNSRRICATIYTRSGIGCPPARTFLLRSRR